MQIISAAQMKTVLKYIELIHARNNTYYKVFKRNGYPGERLHINMLAFVFLLKSASLDEQS